MPVQKFRSVEEMNRAAVERPRLSTFEAFLRHCARYRRLAQRSYPRGVFKFRTLEEAQAARIGGPGNVARSGTRGKEGAQ